MTKNHHLLQWIIGGILLPFATLFAFEEGFFSLWLDQVPISEIEQKYKISLNQLALRKASQSVIRILDTSSGMGPNSGGSSTGTFLSPDGLVISSGQMGESCIRNLKGWRTSLIAPDCIDETCFDLVKEIQNEEKKKKTFATEKDSPQTKKNQKSKIRTKTTLLNPINGFDAKTLEDEIHCKNFAATLLRSEIDVSNKTNDWKIDYLEAHDDFIEKEKIGSPKPIKPEKTTPKQTDKNKLSLEDFRRIRASDPTEWFTRYLNRVIYKEDKNIERLNKEAKEKIQKELQETSGDRYSATNPMAVFARMMQASEESISQYLYNQGIVPGILEKAFNLVRTCENLDDPKISINDYLKRRNLIPSRCELREYQKSDGEIGFALIQYDVIRDIRLVFYPSKILSGKEFGKRAHRYPNFNLDFAIFRVYTSAGRTFESGNQITKTGKIEAYRLRNGGVQTVFEPSLDNHPLDSSSFYFRPDLTNSLKESDFVYTFGHPKETKRWMTYPQAKLLHEVTIPTIFEYIRVRKKNYWRTLISITGRNDSKSKANKKKLRSAYMTDVQYERAYQNLVDQYDANSILASLEKSWLRIKQIDDDAVKEDIAIMEKNIKGLHDYYAFYLLSNQLFHDDLLGQIYLWIENIQSYQKNQKIIALFNKLLTIPNNQLLSKYKSAIKEASFLTKEDKENYAAKADKTEPTNQHSEMKSLIKEERNQIYADTRQTLFKQEAIKTKILNQPPSSAAHLNSISVLASVLEFASKRKLPVFSSYFPVGSGNALALAQQTLSPYPLIPFGSIGTTEEVLKNGWRFYTNNIALQQHSSGKKLKPFPKNIIKLFEFIEKLKENVIPIEEKYGDSFSIAEEEINISEKNLRGLDRSGLKNYSNTNGLLRFSYGSIRGTENAPAICPLETFISDLSKGGFSTMPKGRQKLCKKLSKRFGDVPVHFLTDIDSINAVTLEALGVTHLSSVFYGQPILDRNSMLRGIQTDHNWAAIGSVMGYMNAKAGRTVGLSMPIIAQYISNEKNQHRIFEELIYAANPANKGSYFKNTPSGKKQFTAFEKKISDFKKKNIKRKKK